MIQSKISVIMACYNVEKYLDEAIFSIKKQSLQQEKIEIILVNDGSIDNTAKICKRHQQESSNILYVEQKNQGVSAARNAGLKKSTGEYVTFFDPDDQISKTSLQDAINKLDTYTDIDIVTMPIFFFEGRKGAHPLNNKFSKEFKIIDLDKHNRFFTLSAAATIYRKKALNGALFALDIPLGEDAYFNSLLFLNNRKYGALANARYNYRVRKSGDNALAASKDKIDQHIKKITHWWMPLIEASKNSHGKVLDFIYQSIVYDMCFSSKKTASYLYNNIEMKSVYLKLLKPIIQQIPVNFFFQNHHMLHEEKIALLSWAHDIDGDFEMVVRKGKKRICFLGLVLREPLLEIIELKECENDSLIIKVRCHLFKNAHLAVFQGTSTITPTREFKSDFKHEDAFGNYIKLSAFTIKVKKNTGSQLNHIKFYHQVGSDRYHFCLRYSKFVKPFSGMPITQWSTNNQQQITERKSSFYLSHPSKFSKVKNESRILYYIIMQKKWRALFLRTMDLCLPKFKKNIAIFMDRVAHAGDNAEALLDFHLKHKKLDITPYYVIDQNSADYNRVSKKFNVIKYNSLRHKLILMRAQWLFYSHIDEIFLFPNVFQHRWVLDKTTKAKRIFLSHGVLHAVDVSSWLHKDSKNIAAFIACSEEEERQLVSADFGYNKNEIMLCGLARFDKLYNYSKKNLNEKHILIAPTWRDWICRDLNKLTTLEDKKNHFKNTDYFLSWKDLIDSLVTLSCDHELKIQVIWHPRIIESLGGIKNTPYMESMKTVNYTEQISKCDIFVSDYSSVIYDAIYLYKPSCYYKPNQSINPPYLNNILPIHKNHTCVFGPVINSSREFIEWFREVEKNNFDPNVLYKEIMQKTFKYRDGKSCERIIEHVQGINKRTIDLKG